MPKNIPEGMREFDLELAKQGHPLVTREGRSAKFIAHVPEASAAHQLVFMVTDLVFVAQSNGKFFEDGSIAHSDLFLAPLGFCEGKPVFAGDVLWDHENKEFTIKPSSSYYNFVDCSWPKPKCVVETRMGDDEIKTFWMEIASVNDWKAVANKAIERAIADGDVVPVEVAKKLAGEAYNLRMKGGYSYQEYIDKQFKDYIEGLK